MISFSGLHLGFSRMKASKASGELAWLPGLGSFGSYSMFYRTVALMCIGWFFKERGVCSLVAKSGSSEGKSSSPGELSTVGGKGPLHNTWAGWAGQVPMAEWIHSDLASPNWICALGPGSTRYVVRYSCRTAQVGLSGTSPVKKREPLLEAELSGGSLHGDSFQHFPYCSSCPLAGPTHSQPTSYRGSMLGTLALGPSQRHFQPSCKVLSSLLLGSCLSVMP